MKSTRRIARRLFIKLFFILLSFNSNQADQLPEDQPKKNLILLYRNKLNNLAIGCNGMRASEDCSKTLDAIFKEACEKALLSDLGKDIIAQAFKFGSTDIVHYFIKNNIKIDNSDGDWNMHLFWSCRPDEIFYFNNKNRSMCGFYNHWLATPLHWAAGEGDLEAVKYFVKQGISVLVQDCVESTPIDWALASGKWAPYRNKSKADFLNVILYLIWQNIGGSLGANRSVT